LLSLLLCCFIVFTDKINGFYEMAVTANKVRSVMRHDSLPRCVQTPNGLRRHRPDCSRAHLG
jgi:hypothetical protein